MDKGGAISGIQILDIELTNNVVVSVPYPPPINRDIHSPSLPSLPQTRLHHEDLSQTQHRNHTYLSSGPPHSKPQI